MSSRILFFIFTRRWAIPLIESMAVGLKIVANDTGLIRDVLVRRKSYHILPKILEEKLVSDILRLAVADPANCNYSAESFNLCHYLQTLKAHLEI